jgi:hypothetical protein
VLVKTKRMAIVVGLVALLSVSSCKKTPEAEAKNWERNTRRAQELSALYPGFGPAIKAQQALAQTAMDAARAISSPEEAVRRMSEANGLLTGGFVGGLSSLDGKVRKVREKITSVSASATAGPDQAATQAAVMEAQRVLSGVEAALRQGATEPIGAAAIVRKIETDLSSTTSSLDTLLDAAKKRQEAAKTPQASAAGAEAPGAASAASPKAETWKCTYCGRQNESPSAKCKGCGAPKKG